MLGAATEGMWQVIPQSPRFAHPQASQRQSAVTCGVAVTEFRKIGSGKGLQPLEAARM